MATIIDIIEGSEVREGGEGYEATRIFVVEVAEGTAASAKCYAALTASGIPARGEAHPTIPGLVAEQRSATPLAGKARNKIIVKIGYRVLSATDIADSGAAVMEVSATLSAETTSRDSQGRLIYTMQTLYELDADGSFKSAKTEYNLQQFELQVPTVVLTYKRKQTRNPARDALEFLGKVGDFRKTTNPYTAPWLCTSIEGTTENGGQTYDASFQFMFKKYGWLGRIPRIEFVGGSVLAPKIDSRDWLVSLYEATSFAPLGLPSPPIQPVTDLRGDPAPFPIPVRV